MLTPLCLHTPTVQPDESSRRQGHHGAAIPLNGNGHGNSGRECRIGKGTLWPEEAETTGSRHRVFPDYRSNAPAHMVLAVEKGLSEPTHFRESDRSTANLNHDLPSNLREHGASPNRIRL